MILSPFKTLFIVASIWNLIGAILGFFNTAFTFEILFNIPLNDPLLFAIYQGAWGTTLTYFIGYLIVATNPAKHFGIVVIGTIGKLGFITTLLKLYFSEIADPIIFVIVVGDSLFILAFLFYFYQLFRSRPIQNSRKAVQS